MSTIHLLCGAAGAGKTTLAFRLSAELEAIPLFIDERVKHLKIPQTADFGYAVAVKQAIEQAAQQILLETERFLTQGKDVILDVAAFTRHQRDYIRDWAKQRNAEVILYFVCASPLERWRRVERRNHEKGHTYSLEIPKWWFDASESFFQAPTPEENAIIVNNDGPV